MTEQRSPYCAGGDDPPTPDQLAAGSRVISRRVLKLGLETYEHVVKEFNDAKQGWSKGTLYVCPFCDKDFWSPSGARKHMNTQGHPVLRWDWYDSDCFGGTDG